MIRQAEGTLFGPCAHPVSSLLTHTSATDPATPSVTVTAARLTASGTTCTMALNPEAGGTETHQSLPIGRQRNVKSFSLITTALSLAFCCSSQSYCSYMPCCKIDDIDPRKQQRPLPIETNSFFSLSKTHASFSSSRDSFAQREACAQEKEMEVVAVTFGFPFVWDFICV